MVPGVGAVIGGSLDLVETKVIGRRAYKWFIEDNFADDKGTAEVEIIDAEQLFYILQTG